MSSISFSGLGSGLDTNSIIRQLMALESRPKNALVAQKNKLTLADQAFNTVRSRITSLRSAVSALGQPGDWNAVKADSSDPNKASVSASASSSQGTFSFTVNRLASNHTVASYLNIADLGTTSITSGSTINISTSAGSTSVNVGGGTLNEVVAAINGQSAIGLRAAAVQQSPGQWKLQLTATNPNETVTTAASEFTTGPWGTVSVGQTAQISMGPGGYTVESNSNVFNNLLPGVNVTVKEAGASVINVNVTPDTDALATKVKAMVDAYNAARSEMATQSKYDQTTKVAGPLNGQPSIRSALTQLGNAVIGDEFTNLGVAGISLDRSGNLTFDAAKFNQAYSSDPAATRALFTDPATGFAKRMGDALEGLTNIAGGVLTSGQDALKSQVRDLDTRIAAYETRLTKREETLRRQFTSMDTRIATMQQQFARFQSQLGAG